MTENTIEITKALLVSVDTNDFDNERSLEELKELSKTAGVEVEAILTQKRPAIDTATCIGDGKLSEVLPL
ncbi:MAG: GTPase HflX, partial [Oscillospiraceae bacterium]|nr:GTPase HflX [Oscillospiraceae bacterium]